MTEKKEKPSLFGLDNSNRDFTSKNSWGKNQFNSSFPTSLCCYLHSIDKTANYLSIQGGEFKCAEVPVSQAFNIDPLDDDTYFAFESLYSPYQQYVIGALPRTDLVIQKRSSGECVAGIEVKLTALPDNTTCELKEDKYGSEIVVRPDTIVYLACSIAKILNNNMADLLDPEITIEDWSDAQAVLPFIKKIISSLKTIVSIIAEHQIPFLLQPVWKTTGKSPRLADNCLDVFFWSNAGFTHFITEIANNDPNATRITRPTRTATWLYKMLLEISKNGRFNHEAIIDTLSYNAKNDKAFASSGSITHTFMMSKRLTTPLIKSSQIKEIILGGGQNLLSPERRFDAIIYNSPGLFLK